MSQQIIAKRYAIALFELANEKNMLEQVEAELQEVKLALQENETFFSLLGNPKISLNKKKEIFSAAFSGVSTIVLHTIYLLVDRKREDILLDVIAYFQEISNEARGIAEAKVYTVRPLTDEEEQALSEVFAKRIGKDKLHIQNIVDKSLLGGVKIRIGNKIYDGSVKRKLERIERQIVLS